MPTHYEAHNPKNRVLVDPETFWVSSISTNVAIVDKPVEIKVSGVGFPKRNTWATIYQGDSPQDTEILAVEYLSPVELIVNWTPQESGDYKLIVATGHETDSDPFDLVAIAPENVTPWLSSSPPIPKLATFRGIKEAEKPEKVLAYSVTIERGSKRSFTLLGNYFTEQTKFGLMPTGSTDPSSVLKLDTKFDPNTRKVGFEAKPEGEPGYFNSEQVGVFDLIIKTVSGQRIVEPRVFEVRSIPWTDLRQGGDLADSDITKATRLTINRDANGMYFSGDTGWDTWAYFKGLEHPRAYPKTYEWIFTHTSGSMMIGIGGANANPETTTAYYEAEIVGYFNSQTSFSRFYGDSANSGNPHAVTAGGVKKLVLEHNGEGGYRYWIYEIPSTSPQDWGDTSNLKGEGIIPNVFKQSDDPIAPYFSCNNSNHRLVATRLR